MVGDAGVPVGKPVENVNGIHAQAVGSSLVLAPDGCDDVNWEVQSSRGCMGGQDDEEGWG